LSSIVVYPSLRLGWAALFVALAVTGCRPSGPPVGRVSGKVTFQGQPVTDGRISFFSEKTAYAAEATLGIDGGYRIETEEGGLPVGEYIISIHPPMELGPPDPRTPQTYVEKDVANIPKKYRERSKPLLAATIVEGKNEHNFNME
jgi:hypothetical protein